MERVELKSEAELAKMREAGRIVAEILDALEKAVAPGVTTWDLDQLAERMTYQRGAKPAFKGYLGFPCTLCASVNEEVVHGIPSRKKALAKGDLMKLDFGVVYRGFYGDSARTVPVGEVDGAAAQLIATTRQSLFKGIEMMVPGKRIGDIGHAVQQHVEARGYTVVRDFFGHGIGKKLHEAPHVPNFGNRDSGLQLRSGMVLAVEPMVNAGTDEIEYLDDDWTVVTADGRLSAHFEHTVAITEKGPEILTLSAEERGSSK